MEREWKAGLGVVKIDVRKAFDSLNRNALLAALKVRLGDCVEYRCLHALLVDVVAVLQSSWGVSQVRMNSGIKQGAIESPMLFSFVMELALEQAASKHNWQDHKRVYPDLEQQDLLFMDDGYLWAPDCEALGRRLGQLAEELLHFGLRLNLLKCVLYCSGFCPGRHQLMLDGLTLQASAYLR